MLQESSPRITGNAIRTEIDVAAIRVNVCYGKRFVQASILVFQTGGGAREPLPVRVRISLAGQEASPEQKEESTCGGEQRAAGNPAKAEQAERWPAQENAPRYR